MLPHLLISFLALLATGQANAAMQPKYVPPCPCYTFKVGPAQQTVKIGYPIRVEVMVTNVIDHDIYVPSNGHHPGDLYFVDVKDGKGVRQKMTNYYSESVGFLHAKVAGIPQLPGLFRGKDGKVYLRRYRGSEPARIVKPGQRIKDSILLNDLYNLDKIGTYTVQVKRLVGQKEIDSNVVAVTITN